MSRILDTAYGNVTLNMSYDIEIEYLFDIPNLTAVKKPLFEEVQQFISKYGKSLSVNIAASIDAGDANFDEIEDISSEQTKQKIDEKDIPKLLMKQLEAEAESYAEENGLDAFLW